MRHIAVVLVGTVLLGLGLAGQAQAATWTPVTSGTTEGITAVEYQGADRFWFATANGKIFRQVGGSFQQVYSQPGVVFKDLEFQDGAGAVGFAVGTNGTVVRSANSGATWGPPITLTGGSQTDANNCSGAGQPLGDAESIRFAGNARAWIVAGGSQIFRTVVGATAANVGSAAGGWTYINKNGDGTCRVTEDIDDLFPIPGSDSVFFISKYFGTVFFSSNALISNAAKKSGSAGNGFQQTRRVAGDPANPNRMWAVQPYGTGGSYYARTTDGWASDSGWTLADPDRGDFTKGTDVDYAGGTVLAVGTAGQILESIDGATFYLDPASGPPATADWNAVSLANATNAAIGGVGGQLIVSTNASTVPDIVAPTATISGPSTVVAGQPATYNANAADNAGGSGVNPASFTWSALGTPGGTGNPLTVTFPSPGFFTVRVAFTDNAGNPGTASLPVQVVAPLPPVVQPLAPKTSTPGTKTVTVAGGKVTLKGPATCVPANTSFTAVLSFKRSSRKGALFVKVTRTDFFIDGTRKKIDRRAPFRQRLTVKKLKAGTKHTLKARAYIKVKRGKSPKKSISTSFTVCR